MVDMDTSQLNARLNHHAAAGPSSGRNGVRRRGWLRMLLAAVLVAAGAVVVAVVLGAQNPRGAVVAAARDIDAGQTITSSDVHRVQVDADSSVSLIAWAQRDQLVGHTAAVPVVSGQLMNAGLVGASRWPGAGYAVVAVSVKAGQAPPRLPVGQTVQVLFTAAPNLQAGTRDSSAAPTGVVAQVASVSAAADGGQGARVVSLRAPVETAQRIAAAATVTLLAVNPD
ncbi:hypothetical protein NUM_07830 [Actinocatenispora comari]|uniref:SAF domain-containing protein n=2 Tax=Actinocatenispora comari TaxID=2807577 RepID=A0A8J4A757_9ACTN|nr:hypothetical protein NUM_07830 [Actinocatenispora comari]